MNISELSKFFKPELFLPDIQADNKDDVLKKLVQPLAENGIVKNKDIVVDTLKKRETLGSTGIGKGVAIPHCRTLAVPEMEIVVGISKKGVDYETRDNKKAHLFFLIVAAPQEKIGRYLPALGKVVEFVRNDKIRKDMMKAQSFSEFIEVVQKGE